MIISNLFKTNISCNEYVNIDTSISITISIKDFNGDYVTGRNDTVYIITPNSDVTANRTTLGTVGTSAQDYTFTYTPTMFGLYTIECNHMKKQFLVQGNKLNTFATGFSAWYDETHVNFYTYTSIPSAKNAWKEQTPVIPEALRPEVNVLCTTSARHGDWYIYTNGDMYYRNYDNSNTENHNVSITWAKKISYKNNGSDAL